MKKGLSEKRSERFFHFLYGDELYFEFGRVQSLQVVSGYQKLPESQFFRFGDALFYPVHRANLARQPHLSG